MIIRSLPLVGMMFVAVALSAGCSKKDEAQKGDAKGKPATQVAAKVNGEEITVHQINSVLSRNPNVPPDAAEIAKQDILERLVDQAIAKQQAVEQKLDRQPNVMQAIESSRNEILARAYIDKLIQKQPKPSPEDVKKYYNDNPELFSQRRIYNLEEISVNVQEGLAAKLRDQTAKSKGMQEVANWLKAQNIAFVPNRGVRAAEALPLDILPKIHTMKDGEFRVIESGERILVLRLANSQSAPVTEQQASGRIQQFLFNRASTEAVSAEMKRLKDKSSIEYQGEFVGGAEAARARAKTAAEARSKQLAADKAKAEAEAKARAELKEQAKAEAEARTEAISKARAAAEAQAKLDAEARAKSALKSPPATQEAIDKGVRSLK